MHVPALAWFALVSVGLLAPTGQEKKGGGKKAQEKDKGPVKVLDEVPESGKQGWDPFFDYTNLPPANEEFWAPLGQAQIQMEKALEIAAASEGAPIRVLKAELKSGEGGAAWSLQLFVGGGETEQPKRVNLQVSSLEPKVLRRLELLSMAPDEEETWSVLRKVEVSADIAVALCKEHAQGDKPEPTVTDPRLRRLEFVPTAKAPRWKCELMGFEKELVRRYGFEVNGNKPNIKQKLMLDRFAGEPLRRGQPTALENGMYLFDFIIGDGAHVTADSKVRVNYRLFLLENTKLHDTWRAELPETFVVSQAPLKGMSEGMVGMRAGGKRKIAIPYALAFGEKGNEIAPPKAMVVCDVAIEEVLSE